MCTLNRVASTLLGYPASEVVGKSFHSFLHRAGPPLLNGRFSELVEQGTSRFELVFRSGEGTFIPARVEASLLQVEKGPLVLVIVDHTEKPSWREMAHDASANLTPSPALARVFDRILNHLGDFIAYTSASIFLKRKEGFQIVAGRNLPADSNLIGATFPFDLHPLHQEIQATQQPLLLEDAESDPRFHIWRKGPVIRCWMGVPLMVEGVVIGLITADSTEPDVFDKQDAKLAQAFANQAAIAIEKSRIAEELSREKGVTELLHQISQSLTASLNSYEVALRAIELTASALGAYRGDIFVVQPDTKRLKLLAALGYDEKTTARLDDQISLHIGQGITGTAAATRSPIVIPDVSHDDRLVAIPALNQGVRSAVAVPLVARSELVGVLILSSRTEGFFRAQQVPMLNSIAASVALALQNARLFEAERHRRQEAEMLRKATAALTLDLDLEDVLMKLLERLQQAVPYDSACVMMLEQNSLRAVAARGLPEPQKVVGKEFPVDSVLFERLQEEKKALFFDDVQQLSWLQGWSGTPDVHGCMGVPLIHRGTIIGYLTLDNREVGAYGEVEANLAQAFANQATVTIINAQLLQDSLRASTELRVVSNILRNLNATTNTSQILSTLASGLYAITGCAHVELIVLADEDRCVALAQDLLEVESSAADGKLPPADRQVTYYFEVGESTAIANVMAGRIHMTPDLAAETNCSVEQTLSQSGYRSRLCLPLQVGERVIGYFQLVWRKPAGYRWTNLAMLTQIADAVAMTVEKARLFSETQRRANELAQLAQLSTALRAVDSSREIMEITVDHCVEVFQAEHIRIAIPDTQAQMLRVTVEAGAANPIQQYVYHYDNSIFGHVFQTGEPYLSPHVSADAMAHKPTVADWRKQGYRFSSGLFAPLRAGKSIIGVVSVVSADESRTFTNADLRLLTAIAEIAGSALHRAHILETLEQRVAARTRQLAEANTRLRELDQMKSEFVTNVSHELRTPLTNIKLYLELLRRGRQDRRQQYLDVIQKETGRLYTLIESILDLSHLNVVRTKDLFSVEPVDLHTVVQVVLANHGPQAEAAEIDLLYVPPEQPVVALGDRNQLIQIVTNLVTNAINYTPAQGTVEIILKNADDRVAITVRDTGVGIHEAEREHLFDRFYRSQRTGQSGVPGAGLGLSIVKEIVDLHGGHIHVESQLDIGSVFTVWLPAAI